MPVSTSALRGNLIQERYDIPLGGLTSRTLFAEESRHAYLRFTGTPGGNCTVTVPTGAEDTGLEWTVENATAGGFVITFAGGTGAGIAIPAGSRLRLQYSGSAMTEPDFSGSIIDASAYGIPEDGVTDATDALNALLALGRSIRLSRGKTYLVSTTLLPVAGQTIYGNGATIKRAAQVATTTQTAIVSGVTYQITVASTVGLRVGQRIVLEQGGVYDQSVRYIDAIVGNLVQTSTTWLLNFTGTTNVYVAYPTIDLAGNNVLRDLTFDGNRANFPFSRWEWGQEIHVFGDDNLVDNCRCVTTPGEGLTIASGEANRVVNCKFRQIDGNGVHLSGCTHPLIDGCYFEDTNEDVTVGHADAAITWSAEIVDATISNCYVNTTTLAALGSLHTADNSDVTIEGCTFRNCGRVLDGVMNSATDVITRIVFVNNRVYDCVIFEFTNSNAAPTQFIGRLVIAGNYFQNTKVKIYRAKNVLIESNIFYDPGDTTAVEFDLFKVANLIIKGNTIEGGLYGIYIDGVTSDNTLIEGNVLLNQNLGAVRFESTWGGQNAGIKGNAIANAAGCNASYFGILSRARCRVINNEINLAAVAAAAGIDARTGSLVTGNTVVKGGATYTIRVPIGETDVVLGENFVTNAASDGGTATVIRNEIIIP